jgi:Ca-activated chloride channel family protein
MTFASPIFLLSLALPPLWWWRRRRRSSLQDGMRISALPAGGGGRRARLRGALFGFELAALTLLALALARPQWNWLSKEVKADAVDIMLALDISPSMLSKDFQPDRLRVAKNVLIAFVDNRPYDRIGLVGFAAEAFTQCPLTTDRRVVQQYIDALEVGRLLDGTAIGMGLATAVNRLRRSEARSKVVILVTDGENNEGYISPMQAAGIAGSLGIRVYTVGIGTEGIVMSPSRRNFDGSYDFAPRSMEFDTELLKKMADETGGKFYRAYSQQDMQDIYSEIDRLEKTRIKVTSVKRTTEIGPWLIFGGLILILLTQVLRFGWLRTVTEDGR